MVVDALSTCGPSDRILNRAMAGLAILILVAMVYLGILSPSHERLAPETLWMLAWLLLPYVVVVVRLPCEGGWVP